MKRQNKITLFFLLCITTFTHTAPYHYFAKPFHFGTRFERKGMFDINAYFMSGETNDGHNAAGDKVNALGIYGTHQMHQIGKNVTETNLSVTNKDILNTLWRNTITDSDYATLDFTGKVDYKGGAVSFGLNLSEEFFVSAELPFYSLEIKDPTFTDVTPTDAQDAEWVQFYNNIDAILSELSLSRTATKKTGLNDITLLCGWARSVEDLDNLDFIDVTFTFGGLLGTGAAKDEDKVFSIAPGYDKHHGMVIGFDTAFGAHEYITFGFHAKQILLLKKTKNMRIQTAPGQNGFIKLQKVSVERDMGNLYEVGGFFKLELKQAAIYTGYTYSHKDNDTLVADNAILYPSDNINSDTMLKGWGMHTATVGAEIDFTHTERTFHPKVSIFYNHVVKAKRAFLNHTTGGSAGIAVTFDF
jgi:hypothetical protein